VVLCHALKELAFEEPVMIPGLFVSLLLVATPQQTGRLTGTIVDPSGAPIPGASISLYLPDGASAVLSATTSTEGIFDFIGVRPERYRIEITASGFAKFIQSGVAVEGARQITLPEIRLSLAGATETVEVVAPAQTLDLGTAEVSTTVTQEQIRNLPALNRQISNLFVLQAGVSQNLRANTVINGMRPTYSNLYVDGINIQDSVRLNVLDYIQNRITISQVGEFTVSATNSNPTIGGAASSISISTPSGGNRYHGELLWYNRNSYFAANDWFNNKNGVKRSFLNQNQFGGTIGGPIKHDKLFFFGNYEGLRKPASTTIDNTILTPTARQGILRYRVGGVLQEFDVLKAQGLTISPFMQKMLDQVPTEGNNSQLGDGLNTTGYSFNARSKEDRNNATTKADYHLSTRHVFSATYAWNSELIDRLETGYRPFYSFVPPIYNDDRAKLFSVSYRWTPTATLTNELRGGFNRAPGTFKNRQTPTPYLINSTLATAGLIFSLPVQSGEVAEGRQVNNYNLQDNANWVHGKHRVSFGFQTFQQRTGSYGYNGTIPTYTIGISAASPYGFLAGSIPGASSTDINRANGLLASLAGLLTSGTQQFNPTSRTSGFVSGAAQVNNMSYDNYAFYGQDIYKLHRNLTLTFGMRWDYFPPVNERDSLLVEPIVQSGSTVGTTLLGNSTLDFAGNSVGRPLYKKDLNNFAPSIALAWDVTGTGETAFRAGYNIAYVNDNHLNSVFNATAGIPNSGLSTNRSIANLTARADAPSPIAAPPFQTPSAVKTWFDLSPAAPPAQGLIDPNLAQPYVQQWTVSLEHQISGVTLEARYVGNHLVKGLRQIDFNQVNINQGTFLQDFIRARNNGFLALSTLGTFSPAYNPSIPGSQPLDFFPTLPASGGLAAGGGLNNATVQSLLRSGEIGTLAQTYQSNLVFPYPGFSYFPNPYVLYSSSLTNMNNSTYNAGQFEVRKRTRSGLQVQANYTFSRALTGTLAQRAIEALLDNARPGVEKAIANFDQRHAFKLNHYIPLPIGGSHKLRFGNGGLDRIIDGWALSGFVSLYSGSPVGVLSNRGTFNRGARSTSLNTVDSNLTYPELQKTTGFFMTADGPYWIEPSHVHPTLGTGVAPDGQPPFEGQVFFNPAPGTIGSLQRRIFRGPTYKSYDLGIVKTTRIIESQTIEFHAIFYNVFNHPNFFLSDQNVNSSTFGKILSQNYNNAGVGPRLIEFGLHYRF